MDKFYNKKFCVRSLYCYAYCYACVMLIMSHKYTCDCVYDCCQQGVYLPPSPPTSCFSDALDSSSSASLIIWRKSASTLRSSSSIFSSLPSFLSAASFFFSSSNAFFLRRISRSRASRFLALHLTLEHAADRLLLVRLRCRQGFTHFEQRYGT